MEDLIFFSILDSSVKLILDSFNIHLKVTINDSSICPFGVEGYQSRECGNPPKYFGTGGSGRISKQPKFHLANTPFGAVGLDSP